MKKEKYRIRKYRKCPFETYEPEKRIELRKEQAVPILVRIGQKFLFLGGMIGLFLSGLIISVKSFFKIKKKIKRNILKEKVVEFRIKR